MCPERKESQRDSDIPHTRVGLEEGHQGQEDVCEEHGMVAGEGGSGGMYVQSSR